MMSISMTDKKLIHIAQFQPYHKGKGKRMYLFLRHDSPHRFTWYEEIEGGEIATEVFASTVKEAMRLAHRFWKKDGFRTVICGFRYTLPERDEHGINAFFHQMVASYSHATGIYFDEELGHNCHVQNASHEALDLWRKLEQSQRL